MGKGTDHPVLDENFFERDTLNVAEDLLGKHIVRRNTNGERSLRITEVEAYDGFEDQASHARSGRTPRSGVMFGPSGHIYVYLIYGIHWMVNVVTREDNYPAAILIRGTEEIQGPGKIGKYLEINKTLNGKKAVPESGLWFEDRGIAIPSDSIVRKPRIGINYAGPIWSQKLYRFLLLNCLEKR